MIDKITPRPDAKVEAMLAEDHIGGLDAVVTSKNTYIAPFVNAEECEYLVIEDAFPNGKPALDKGGIIFTDRATVDKVEKMKVCTCLNPLHTALAIYGCLLGYTLISEEMKNPLLKNMVEVIGYKEGLPVVVNPGILDPKKFIDEAFHPLRRDHQSLRSFSRPAYGRPEADSSGLCRMAPVSHGNR